MTVTEFNPLTTLISCRVRLTEDQRQSLKAAYREKRNSAVPASNAAIGGSTVSVVTQYTHTDVDKELGMSELTFADLVNSRDTISLPVILQLQTKLGVSVISKKDIIDASKSYAEYCFNKFAS